MSPASKLQIRVQILAQQFPESFLDPLAAAYENVLQQFAWFLLQRVPDGHRVRVVSPHDGAGASSLLAEEVPRLPVVLLFL